MSKNARDPLSAKVHARLVALVDGHGVQGAAKRSGLTRHQVMSLIAAPECCQAGTIALAEKRLAPKSEPPPSTQTA